MDKLSELRYEIDKVNAQLVELLNARAALAKKVGQAKGAAPKFVPAREAEVIKECQKNNKGPLPNEAIGAIMREVIGACLNLEQQLKIAYLGPEGTYSQIAAQKRFGAMAQYVTCKSIDLAIAAVSRGLADVAVVPVENSIEGSVTHTLDLLYGADLTVCGEVVLPINHQLLANADFAKITEVKSHPQSLAQCRSWLQSNLPDVKITPVASNAEAAKQASDKNSTCAAIASAQAGKLYGLQTLASNIADEQNNTTRFLVVGAGIDNKATKNDITALVCTVPHAPGALYDLLGEFAKSNINVLRLVSRPEPQEVWRYRFYLDVSGSKHDKDLSLALQNIKNRKIAQVKILGSYPKEV